MKRGIQTIATAIVIGTAWTTQGIHAQTPPPVSPTVSPPASPTASSPASPQPEAASAQNSADQDQLSTQKPDQTATLTAETNDLLMRLEHAGADIHTLSADIRSTKQLSEIEGSDRQIRRGMLMFKTIAAPSKNEQPGEEKKDSAAAGRNETIPVRFFRIDFTSLEVDDKRRDEKQSFIFDGEWLIEKNEEAKQMIRRQVVEPGKRVDPLEIGQGPFPVPIGQKKERILERFEARVAEVREGWPGGEESAAGVKWLDETVQLVLKPKRGSQESRSYALVRIWYMKDSLLPRLIWLDNKNGASTEVLLLNLQANVELAGDAFDVTVPKGWTEQVEEYRPAAE